MIGGRKLSKKKDIQFVKFLVSFISSLYKKELTKHTKKI